MSSTGGNYVTEVTFKTGLKTLENKLIKKFDEVIEKLDGFAGDVQDKRDEQTLHQGQHDEITERLDGIDSRVKKLEHPTQ